MIFAANTHQVFLMTKPIRGRGFSLLEVLIALLVFSLGLLGMAGLTLLSIRTNHSAYLRTQASFIAEVMADRMRANIVGVWNDAYDGTYPNGAADPACDTGSTGCSPADVVVRDQWAFNSQLAQFLPNSSATITCTPTAGAAASAQDLLRRRPYNGTCVMTVTWNETQLQTGAAAVDAKPMTLTWAFQP
jgi:type IV pilus assembly protein PilV